jgi:predicted secreted protein
MWKIISVGLAWGALPGARTAAMPPVAANPAFNAMLEQYRLDFLDLEPMLGLSHNDRRHPEEFDDSLEDRWRTRMAAVIDKYLAASAAFPAESLWWAAEDHRQHRGAAAHCEDPVAPRARRGGAVPERVDARGAGAAGAVQVAVNGRMSGDSAVPIRRTTRVQAAVSKE